MQTIDIHTHLLSKDVKFDRLFDKIAINVFAKKFNFDIQKLKQNPFHEYQNTIAKQVRASLHVEKIVIFGVDAKINDQGEVCHKDKTVCASNVDVLKFYENNKDIIVPFFSINPMRKNALDLIDYYYEKGFRGAKFLQSYWGVDTSEKRYLAYFEKLKKLNLPLIIHVGNENSIQSIKEFESIKMLYAPLKVGVKTICAHMAVSYNYKNILSLLSLKEKNFSKEYFILLELLQTHDNLYADISAILTPFRAKVLKHLSTQNQIHDKLLFGTDFPVPYSCIYNTYDLSLIKRICLHNTKNPFDRYVKAILEYFDKNNPIWTNYQKILNQT